MTFSLSAALQRLRRTGRDCRRAALGMQPSMAKSALERAALRWEIIAEAEARRAARLTPANEA